MPSLATMSGHATVFATRVFVALVVSCASVTGCGPATVPDARESPLVEFSEPRLVGSRGGLVLDYDSARACLALSPRVAATIDGRPVAITHRGEYERTRCGGDCEREGGNGALRCVHPQIAASDAPVDGSAFTVVVTDGATTFRAIFAGDQGFALLSPTGRPAVAGDRVVFHTSLPAAQRGSPHLARTDGRSITGVRFSATPTDDGAGVASYELREGDCSDGGATLDARVFLPITATTLACEGGLRSCSFTDKTADVPIAVALSDHRAGCR